MADGPAWVGRQGVIPKASGDARLTRVANVTISPSAAPSSELRPLRRAIADDAVLTAPDARARVNVPASESSRAKGAGGGSVDEE